MTTSVCPPAICMPEELNSIPREHLLKPLLIESAEDTKLMQDQSRGILVGTQLQAWSCSDSEVVVVHTCGATGKVQ